jgi:hypothetical protein
MPLPSGPRQSPAKTLLSRRRSTAGPIAIAIAAAGGGAGFAVAGAIATVADEPRASGPDVVNLTSGAVFRSASDASGDPQCKKAGR